MQLHNLALQCKVPAFLIKGERVLYYIYCITYAISAHHGHCEWTHWPLRIASGFVIKEEKKSGEWSAQS